MKTDNAVGTSQDPSAAPLMEHLRELRRRLLWIIGVVLGASILIMLFASQPLMGLIQWPISRFLDGDDLLKFETFIATAMSVV